VRGNIFIIITGGGNKCTGLQGSSQCPLVVLLKVGCRQVRAMGKEEGRVMRSGLLGVYIRGKNLSIRTEFSFWKAAQKKF
jgi:hypothetical protein